ncbi:MAG: phage capsid protein [Alphaproteobacteria bacterium]
MSYQVPVHHVQQFNRNLTHLAQQNGSRLRMAVREEQVTGDRMYIDQLGPVTAVRNISRHADTPLISTPHFRRRIVPYPYDWADLIDREDQVRTIHELTNPYAEAGAMAMGRAVDEEIVSAVFGTAYTGQDGTTPIAFPAGQVVAVNSWAYESGSGNVGLTVSKLIEAKVKLDDAEIDGTEQKYFACTATDLGNLLGTTKATSSDFVNVKGLASGEIDSFMGFRFIRLPDKIFPKDSNGYRRCFAWVRSGIGLGIARDITTRIDPRPDKRYAQQVYVTMDIGAARLEEAKVVEVKCA